VAGTLERLAGTPGVQRAPTSELELFIVRDFLVEQTCAAIIGRIDAERRPSTIADDTGIANFRTSETCDLDGIDPVVSEVDRKIADLLGLDLGASGPLQGQRYAAGQEFKPHTDTFEPGGYDFSVHTANQGQRTWTAMIYLNEPEGGGATRFKAIAKTIRPERGKLLGLEQSAERRAAQLRDSAPGHEGALRNEVRPDEAANGQRADGLFDPRVPALAKRLHVHRLDVDELTDAEGGAFATVARVLDAAERRSRIGTDVLVDEAQAGFELLRSDPPATVEI
jgi:prolyl 4-hydroxylase